MVSRRCVAALGKGTAIACTLRLAANHHGGAEPVIITMPEHQQMRKEMDRMMGEENAATVSDWVPAVDIKEDKDCFTITADVPGITAKDIEVHAENGVLSIRGERESEKKESREGYKRIERSYGSFFRRFTLPDTADTDKITTKTANGVLTVTIPKHEKLQPRKITVEGE